MREPFFLLFLQMSKTREDMLVIQRLGRIIMSLRSAQDS